MNKIEVTFRERQLSGGVRVDIFEVKPSQIQQVQSHLREKGAKLYPNVKFVERSGFLRVAEEIPGGSCAGHKAPAQPKKSATTKTAKKTNATPSKNPRAQKSEQGFARLSDLTGNNPMKGQAIHIGWDRLIKN